MADQTENAYQKQASLSVGGRKSKQYKMKGGKVRSTFHRSAPAAAAPPSSLRGRGAGRDGGWWEGGAEGPRLCFRELGSASANSEQHRAASALHLRLAAPAPAGEVLSRAGKTPLRSERGGARTEGWAGEWGGGGGVQPEHAFAASDRGVVLAEHAVVQECWAGLQGETSRNPPCTSACSAHNAAARVPARSGGTLPTASRRA